MRSLAYRKFVLVDFISSSNQSQFRRLTDYSSLASDFLYNKTWPLHELEINQWSQLQQHKETCFKHLNPGEIFNNIRVDMQGPLKWQVSMLEPSLVLPYLAVPHAWFWAIWRWQDRPNNGEKLTIKGCRLFEI